MIHQVTFLIFMNSSQPRVADGTTRKYLAPTQIQEHEKQNADKQAQQDSRCNGARAVAASAYQVLNALFTIIVSKIFRSARKDKTKP